MVWKRAVSASGALHLLSHRSGIIVNPGWLVNLPIIFLSKQLQSILQLYIYIMIFIYIIYINFLEMSSRSSKSLNSRCEALESKSSEKMCWRSWTEEFGRRNDGFHDMFDDIFTSFSYDFL